MTETTRIELHLILPDIPGERDACVVRLQARLGGVKGISRGHVVTDHGGPASLCLHYDPAVLSLAEVERVVRASGAELHDQYDHALLAIRAVTSEDAAASIEAALRAVPGVTGASVSIPAQRVQVEFERERTSVERLQKVLDDLGYPAGPSDDHDHDHGTRYARNKEFVRSLAAGTLLAVAWAGETWLGFSHPLAIGLYLAAYGFGGFELIAQLIKAARQGRFRFDIDLLMLLAAVGAGLLGEWVEGEFLLFLFSLAHALEHYALGLCVTPSGPWRTSHPPRPGSGATARSRRCPSSRCGSARR